VDRRVARRAERLEQGEDLVLLDELAHHLDRLGRAVAVVQRDELDLAAADAARLVDRLEVGVDRPRDRGIGRGRAAVGIGVADLDLGVGHPVVVLLLREGRSRTRSQGQRRYATHETTPACMHLLFLPEKCACS
jgi:hypothetical protein